jgi:hypothetical protein
MLSLLRGEATGLVFSGGGVSSCGMLERVYFVAGRS